MDKGQKVRNLFLILLTTQLTVDALAHPRTGGREKAALTTTAVELTSEPISTRPS